MSHHPTATTSTTRATTFTEGTLVIDLYDPDEQQLVWRGSATVTLKGKPEGQMKQTNKVLKNDLFLIGTVSYIAAIDLYKLFIGNVEIRLPMRLKIENLKDLEDKIVGVLVAALAVAFLGQAAGSDEPSALLNYGGGIAGRELRTRREL